jgi:hypothetical protein
MKERPILFSGAMVRALLDGSKTQTRRIVKLQPVANHRGKFAFDTFTDDEAIESYWQNYPLWGPVRCPFGKAGDRLWVRETFCLESNRMTDDDAGAPHNDGRPVKRFGDDDCYWSQPHYKASDPEPELWYEDMDGPGCRWTPSIHMPRWASRIMLEVIDVRVERLQDISETDALAEGIRQHDQKNGWVNECTLADGKRHFDASAYGMFQQVWADINGAESWDTNPWIWVIEFNRVMP